MGLLKFFYALKELEQKIFHKESYAFNATQKHDSKVGGYKNFSEVLEHVVDSTQGIQDKHGKSYSENTSHYSENTSH